MKFLKGCGLIIVIIIGLIVILFSGCKLHDYRQRRDAERLVLQLESYRSQHGNYPSEAKAILNDFRKGIHYYTDAGRTYFSIAFSEGIMGVNTVSYDSRTKKWDKVFNF